MKEEVDALLNILEDKKDYDYYNIKYFTGRINNLECVIGQSGVGKVNAARCTQILIDKFEPTMIINIGSAGALEPSLDIGDIVISTSCIHHDADITAFGHKKGYMSGIGDRYIKADPELIEKCKEASNIAVSSKYKHLVGVIASGDQFISSSEKKEEIYKEFGALCAEMEGAAIAQVCLLSNVPFVVIRSISDKSVKGNEIDFREYIHFASERCAIFINALTKLLS